METKLASAKEPPNNGDNVATCAGEFDDDIKELGNKIVALNNKQASELSRYLKECNM
jgi:hypothetical protein